MKITGTVEFVDLEGGLWRLTADDGKRYTLIGARGDLKSAKGARVEVEGALDMKVAYEIPSDRAVPVSVNRGNPAVLGDAGSEFSGAVKRLALGIANPTPAAARKAKKGLFSLAKA